MSTKCYWRRDKCSFGLTADCLRSARHSPIACISSALLLALNECSTHSTCLPVLCTFMWVQPEMQGWLAWQKLRLPMPEDAEMTDQDVVDFMEVETGRNLLFLRAFRNPTYVSSQHTPSSSSLSRWTLSDALARFRNLKEVEPIDTAFRALLCGLSRQSPSRVRDSLEFMLQRVAGSVVTNSVADLYDARYFYTTSSDSVKAPSQRHWPSPPILVGHTIAHVVDSHVVRLARERGHATLLIQPFWMAGITEHARDPIKQGFLVKEAALSYLSDDVVRTILRGVVTIPAEARPRVQWFYGGSEKNALLSDAVVLYIPRGCNYPTDAVLRVVHRTVPPGRLAGMRTSSRRETEPEDPTASIIVPPVKITVTILPIQITMRAIDEDKRRRSLHFFDDRKVWSIDHSDAAVKFVSIFISGDAGMQRQDEGEQIVSGVSVREMMLPLDEVSLLLADTVRRARVQPTAGY